MCRILTCYYRPKPGGFCKRLFRAINALLERGHTVHYLAVVPFPIEHNNCQFHKFPWPENKTEGYIFWAFFHLIAPLQLLYIGLRCRINRLFAFGHNYSLLLQPLRLAKRIPLTLFHRADTLENHKIKRSPKWLIMLECKLEGLGIFGVRMYGVSQVLADNVDKRHSLLRPRVTGILRNEIKKIKSVEKKIICLPLRLACVGILEKRKNQQFLLEVMRGFQPEQAQLYLYGIGPDEQKLRKMVENEKLSNRVHLMGWVEADKIWLNIDVLLMPSLHEGAPNAVLEAIANGVPVLASDIAEHWEILSKSNLFSINTSTAKSQLIRMIKKRGWEANAFTKAQAGKIQKLQFNWNKRVTDCIIK